MAVGASLLSLAFLVAPARARVAAFVLRDRFGAAFVPRDRFGAAFRAVARFRAPPNDLIILNPVLFSQGGHSHIIPMGIRTAATTRLIGCDPP